MNNRDRHLIAISGVSLISVIIFIFLYGSQLFSIFHGNNPQPKTVKSIGFQFTDIKKIPPDLLIMANKGNWQLSNIGLCVRPNEKAVLILPFIPAEFIKSGQRLGIKPQLVKLHDVHIDASIWSLDKQGTLNSHLMTLSKNRSLFGKVFDLTPFISDINSPLALVVNADFSPTIRSFPVGVLKDVEFIVGDIRVSKTVPVLFILLFTTLLPLLIFSWSDRSLNIEIAISAALFVPGLFCISFFGFDFASCSLLILSATAVIIAYLLKTSEEKMLTCVTMTIIILVGLYLRWNILTDIQLNHLAGDAQQYRDLAINLTNPFSTGTREPFFVWMQKGFQLVFGNGPLTSRLISLCFSLLLIYATYYLGKIISGTRTALLSTAIISLNPWLASQSVRGLRLELYSVMLICFVVLLIKLKRTRHTGFLIAASIMGGFLSLLRINSFWLVLVPLFIWSLLYTKRKLWSVLPAVLIPLIMIVPHLIHNYRVFKDPWHSINTHVLYYKNYEVRSNMNYTTLKELEIDEAYSGEKETPFKYIFQRHSISQVITNTVKGYLAVYNGFLSRSGFFKHILMLKWLFMIGAIIIIFTRYWYLLLNMIYWIGPTSFIIGTATVFDPRLAYHIMPFIALTCALTISLFFEKNPENIFWVNKAFIYLRKYIQEKKSETPS